MNKVTPLLLLLVLMVAVLHAQPRAPKLPKFNKNKEKNTFLRKQWFLGFKAGANLSSIDNIKAYSAISPTNYPAEETNKRYVNYADIGTQATLEATFYFTGLSLSLQPTYRHNRFTYENAYRWSDAESPTNMLELHYVQQQRIDYFELPLLARYEKMFNNFSPYVQGGLFSAFLVNANKSVDISGVDYASGGINEFRNEKIIVGATDLFARNHWGLIGGVGLYYNLGNVRLNLDVVYRHGMSNITSTENRFGSDRLSGVGDTLDDMKLNTFCMTAGCLFPLRFLGRNFKSTEKK